MYLPAALCILGLCAFALAADDPKKAGQVYNRAVQAEAAGRLDEAVALYTQALTAQPQVAAALKRRGRILQQRGQAAEAAQDFTASVALAPGDGETWKLLGDARLALLDFSSALDALQRALRLNFSTAAAYRAMADARAGTGDKQGALEALDQCVRLRLDNPEPYLARGRIHASLERYRDAIEDYDRALALQPEFADAYFERGHAQGQLGSFDRALADFNVALKLRPEPRWPFRANALTYRGAAYDTLGQAAPALKDYTDSLAANPANARVLITRGDLLARQGNHTAAFADRDRAVQLEPNNATAYLVRGSSYHMLGQHEKGLADRTRAIQLDPRNAQIWFARGSAYFLLNQREQAIADLEQAQKLDPGNSEVQGVLARARQSPDSKPVEPTPAAVVDPPKPVAPPVEQPVTPPVAPQAPPPPPVETTRPAVVLKLETPNVRQDATAYHNTGRTLLQQSKFPEAIEALTRALELKPNWSLVWNARGYAYMRLGQWAKAVADFEQALKIDPNYQNAKMNRDAAARQVKK